MCTVSSEFNPAFDLSDGQKLLRLLANELLKLLGEHNSQEGFSPNDYGLAATQRQVVAMGVSLWFRDNILRLSPDETTRRVFISPRLGLNRRGLCRCQGADHKLTPIAIPYLPIGTESQRRMMLRVQKKK